jgi:hypothetical protein
MIAGNSAGIACTVSRSAMGEAVARGLRLFIGRGREFSVKIVANRTGVPDRAIESAMVLDTDSEDWRPLKPEYLAALGRFLGPEFNSAWMVPLCDQAAVALPSEDDDDGRALGTVEDAVTLARADMAGDRTAVGNARLRPVALRLMVSAGRHLRAAA